MGKLDLALEDALECIAIDASWVKGYFRKGQVLNKMKRFGEAYIAFQKAVEMEPSNKSALQHMTQAKQQAEELGLPLDRVEQVMMGNTTKVQSSSSTTTMGNSKPPAETPKKQVVSDVVKEADGELNNVRGYKKLADGRTTTYFNNELSEEDKKLIGSIAPKKIDKADDVKVGGLLVKT